MGSVLSVNLADVRVIERRGKPVRTGIWKLPAAGRVHAGREGLAGDVQADRRVHGGPDMAVYSYAREDEDWWETQLGRELANGTFGENLTLRGVDVTAARVGERWRIGEALLEVSAPRIPCWKLGVKMDDPRFVKTFARALRPGAYLRVIEEGELAAGDDLELVDRPDHAVSVGLIAEAYLADHSLAPRLLAADALPDSWRDWATARAA
ncbi:MAG: MOSC domain-containing protein [Thermoleophilaceae bacterium]